MLTIEQIVTVDGFAADPEGGMDFVNVVEMEDFERTDHHQMRFVETVDAIVLGRRTYEMFSSFWPGIAPAVDAIAGPINTLPKFVVSSTLGRAPWGDGACGLVLDGLAGVRSLSERFESIVVWGSLSLCRALVEAGMVDVLRLRTVPVLLGDGLGFLPAFDSARPLRLVKSHPYPHRSRHECLRLGWNVAMVRFLRVWQRDACSRGAGQR